MNDFVIKLDKVSKKFDERGERKVLAVSDISLEVKAGEFFVFVGQSGSGKSTLLRIMSGLEKKFHGKLEYGEGVSPTDVGFVFQQFALWPWLTVRENIELPLITRKMAKAERVKIVTRELETFRLTPYADAHIRELSGGQRQRAGLARALAVDPKIIFMDEPFSELDSFTAEELRKEILDIWQKRAMTIIMVTHIIPDAIEMADRVAVLSASPGRLKRVVHNHMARPRHKRSEEFFRLEDELDALIKSHD